MSMGGFPPIHKSFGGLLVDQNDRMVMQERRRGKRPPERLGPRGMEVTDWNNAIDAGFYWSDAAAANGPTLGNLANAVAGWVITTPAASGDLVGIRQYAQRTTDQGVLMTRYRLSTGTWGSWFPVDTDEVVDGGTIAHSTAPTGFGFGITLGQSDGSYPAGTLGLVEVVKYADARAVQRVTYKGEGNLPSATYQRSAAGTGTSWGPWMLVAGATDWVSVSSNFLDASATIKRSGDTGMLRASVNTDVPMGTSSTDVTSTGLDSMWRPPANMFGSAYSAGVSATAFLRPDGTVAISNRNAIALTGTIFITIPIMY